MSLQSNTISHKLGSNLESELISYIVSTNNKFNEQETDEINCKVMSFSYIFWLFYIFHLYFFHINHKLLFQNYITWFKNHCIFPSQQESFCVWALPMIDGIT